MIGFAYSYSAFAYPLVGSLVRSENMKKKNKYVDRGY